MPDIISTQLYPPHMSGEIQRDYRCSVCWAYLAIYHRGAWDEVRCPNYDEHRGFHSVHFIEKQRQYDIIDRVEVKKLMHELGVIPNPHAGKTPEQFMQELGY